MDKMDKKSIVEIERTSTDTSLGQERLKTDVALSRGTRSIEQVADAALEASRVKLDDAIDSDRVASDLALDGIAVSEQVLEERRRIDLRIGHQRGEADETIRRERQDRKDGEGERLTGERRQTDASLRHERHKVDGAYGRKVSLLAEERAAHADTKLAVKARDEALAIVSHDLQDALSIITLCSTEFLGLRGEQRLTELEVQWIETIRRHASGMFRLVTDLLDVEVIARGSLKLSLSSCNIGRLVQEMLADFQILAERQELTLSAEIPSHVVIARADQERVRQVLANLISNALKFTPKAGKIVVRLAETDTDVRISVADTGPGIAKAERKRLFERFSKLGEKNRKGVGLGLYISKWIVDAHNGAIWLEGEPGAGSTFYVSLPRIP